MCTGRAQPSLTAPEPASSLLTSQYAQEKADREPFKRQLANPAYQVRINPGRFQEKEGNMRRSAPLLVVLLVLVLCCTAFAQKKSITLPPGTTVEKIGPGHFKFKLPNKQIVEVKNFDLKRGTVGLVSIIDPDPPGKPVVTGKQGTLGQVKKLTQKEAKSLPRTSYIEIDDEVTWLPITITIEPVK